MRHEKYQYLLKALFLIFFSVSAQAETSVWLVEKGDSKFYLGGTLHLLSASDFPLPAEYDQAYSESETLVFEADITQASSLEGQAMAMSAMMYKDGRTLQSVLKPKTYQQLEAYLQPKGMPMIIFNQFTAGGMSVTISALEMQALGYTQGGVDQYFINKAQVDGKPQLFLERLEEQLAFIASLGEGQEDEIIEYSLDEIKRMPAMLNSMKRQWRTGDIEGLESTAIAEMRLKFPSAYQSLLVERNQNWMPQLKQMMNTKTVEFILVGAAHLAGNEGLVQQLIEQGYKVEKL